MDKSPLQQMLEDAGFDCQDYSGRAMFGRRCLAMVLDAGRLGSLIQALMEACLNSDPDGGDEYDAMGKAAQQARYMRWDNMGMDMVYYWPDVPYVGDDEKEEDEDAEQ